MHEMRIKDACLFAHCEHMYIRLALFLKIDKGVYKHKVIYPSKYVPMKF